ncbi:transmembrane emp24 domain-containing protein 10 [Protopterus annectens]|uniref:transmembrane emp24 domain-containing protein 10 n=1 Tax=Protopterus annectens TaxID=7888 RepID=UPI001CFB4329|nr:transmembrane emp24 domain-containing protein 10 [Protopterus annectens]
MKSVVMAWLLKCIFLFLFCKSAFSISFHLPVNSRKCLREEIHKNVLVTGEYEVSEQPSIKTHLKITDSAGHILYAKEDASKGKFAFTTEDYDMFEVCFESRYPMVFLTESTNTRVLYFSIFSMCCLIGLATWQVFYLRRFFKAKKLIE